MVTGVLAYGIFSKVTCA